MAGRSRGARWIAPLLLTPLVVSGLAVRDARAVDLVSTSRSVELSETVEVHGYTCLFSDLKSCETTLSSSTTPQTTETLVPGDFSETLTAVLGEVSQTSTLSDQHLDASGAIDLTAGEETVCIAYSPGDCGAYAFVARHRSGSARSVVDLTFVLDEPGPIGLGALVHVDPTCCAGVNELPAGDVRLTLAPEGGAPVYEGVWPVVALEPFTIDVDETIDLPAGAYRLIFEIAPVVDWTFYAGEYFVPESISIDYALTVTWGVPASVPGLGWAARAALGLALAGLGLLRTRLRPPPGTTPRRAAASR